MLQATLWHCFSWTRLWSKPAQTSTQLQPYQRVALQRDSEANMARQLTPDELAKPTLLRCLSNSAANLDHFTICPNLMISIQDRAFVTQSVWYCRVRASGLCCLS